MGRTKTWLRAFAAMKTIEFKINNLPRRLSTLRSSLVCIPARVHLDLRESSCPNGTCTMCAPLCDVCEYEARIPPRRNRAYDGKELFQ